MTKKEVNYQSLNEELSTIMTRLQNDELSIDEALESYERGMKIVEELQNYLEQTENKIEKIKARFDKPAGK